MTKQARILNGGEKNLFNNWCCKNWTATCEKMKLGHFLILYTQINSRWIKDTNIRLETIKLLEENIGRTLFDIYHKNIFLALSPKAKET